jgi:LacI family transcriptional regulator
MKRPTQVDVARLAGVSRATVSYVLNRQTDGRVPISEETRQRVLEAVAELGYEPDARAQSLRSGSTKTIGLLIPDLQNPHFWQIINGANQEARRAGYDLLLTSSDLDRQQEEESLKALSRRRVDGLILLTAFTTLSSELLKETAARRLPIVMIGCKGLDFDCIGSNYSESAADVMTHLRELGHERIAFIHGVANEESGLDRLQPYKDSLTASGLPVNEDLIVHCGATTKAGFDAAKQLLTQSPRPTAIIVVNDLLAGGVIRAAADLGLSIPQDFSLVSFDDIPAANYMTPRLTTVRTDAEAIGRGAVGLVLQRLGERKRPLQAISIPTQLMVRESTGPIPQEGGETEK